jgi:hypothetical protein
MPNDPCRVFRFVRLRDIKILSPIALPDFVYAETFVQEAALLVRSFITQFAVSATLIASEHLGFQSFGAIVPSIWLSRAAELSQCVFTFLLFGVP